MNIPYGHRLCFLTRGIILSLAIFQFLGPFSAPAHGGDKIIVYFFWSEGCPHCEKEKVFLAGMKGKYPGLDIQSYEVKKNPDNAMLFTQISEIYGLKIGGVPATFVGGLSPVIGYLGDAASGREIEDKIRYCVNNPCNDPMSRLGVDTLSGAILDQGKSPQKEGLCAQDEDCPEEAKKKPQETMLTLPVIGAIDTAKTALSYQTVIIAGLDSFNPCAFFVLITLLGLMIHAQSRKRVLLIGGIFVFFSGFIYFIFMAAWLNIFLLTGQVAAVTVAAGVIALIIAAINIKDFFFFKKGVSLSIPDSAKPKLFERMRKLLKADSLPAVISGAVVLAVAANAYELFCTAGFPMVYTRILTLHNLSKLSYYLYLALYNVIYVTPLALVVVFFAVTLGAKKLTERQGRILKLISGMMMLCLGLLLILKPELLNNIVVTSGILGAALLLSAIIIFTENKVLRQG
ncbi:MAG: thioredoxin family protein [Nitrospirae bacterium]|nr:thioredoxin family protein [Nitrospirota bacterium]